MWQNTSRLLLWIHMHGRNGRLVLPASGGVKRQQRTLVMGTRAGG